MYFVYFAGVAANCYQAVRITLYINQERESTSLVDLHHRHKRFFMADFLELITDCGTVAILAIVMADKKGYYQNGAIHENVFIDQVAVEIRQAWCGI